MAGVDGAREQYFIGVARAWNLKCKRGFTISFKFQVLMQMAVLYRTFSWLLPPSTSIVHIEWNKTLYCSWHCWYWKFFVQCVNEFRQCSDRTERSNLWKRNEMIHTSSCKDGRKTAVALHPKASNLHCRLLHWKQHFQSNWCLNTTWARQHMTCQGARISGLR